MLKSSISKTSMFFWMFFWAVKIPLAKTSTDTTCVLEMLEATHKTTKVTMANPCFAQDCSLLHEHLHFVEHDPDFCGWFSSGQVLREGAHPHSLAPRRARISRLRVSPTSAGHRSLCSCRSFPPSRSQRTELKRWSGGVAKT